MGALDGKVALVTGAASAAGARIVGRFVDEGARVFIGDLDAAAIAALVARHGHNAVDGLQVELRDEHSVRRMVEGAVRRFGRLDIAINCAAVSHFAPLHDYPVEDFRRVLETCLTGTKLYLKHESRQFLRAGRGGSIINVLSLDTAHGAGGLAACSMAAAGVSALTTVAAAELAHDRIRVNAIVPGTTEPRGSEEDTLIQRLGQARDLPALVVSLSSDAYSAVTGQILDTVRGEPPTEPG